MILPKSDFSNRNYVRWVNIIQAFSILLQTGKGNQTELIHHGTWFSNSSAIPVGAERSYAGRPAPDVHYLLELGNDRKQKWKQELPECIPNEDVGNERK